MKITVTLSAVALVAILVLYSPYRARTDYCLHCQRSHDTLSWLGIRLKDSVRENDISRWMDALNPGHTEHEWAYASSTGRSRFFGKVRTGDGGFPILKRLYLLRDALGADQVKQYLERYTDALHLGRDERYEALHSMDTELQRLMFAGDD